MSERKAGIILGGLAVGGLLVFILTRKAEAKQEVVLQTTNYFDSYNGAWLALRDKATVHFHGVLMFSTGWYNPNRLPYIGYAEFKITTPSGQKLTGRTADDNMSYYAANIFGAVEIYSYEQGEYNITVNLYAGGFLQDVQTFNVTDVWL